MYIMAEEGTKMSIIIHVVQFTNNSFSFLLLLGNIELYFVFQTNLN